MLIPLQPQKDNHRNGKATNPVSALSLEGTHSVALDKAAPRLPRGQQQDRAAEGRGDSWGCWGWAGLGAFLPGQPRESLIFGPQSLCLKSEGEKEQTSKGLGACRVS